MAWQENLVQNLLSVTILAALGITIYCRVARKTLTEFIIEVREAFSVPIEE